MGEEKRGRKEGRKTSRTPADSHKIRCMREEKRVGLGSRGHTHITCTYVGLEYRETEKISYIHRGGQGAMGYMGNQRLNEKRG